MISFLMIFLKVLFCMKISDFLKSDVLRRREHRFWRSGCELEGLWNAQHQSKVLSEQEKYEQQNTSWKLNKIMIIYEKMTLPKCRIYHTNLMFSRFFTSFFHGFLVDLGRVLATNLCPKIVFWGGFWDAFLVPSFCNLFLMHFDVFLFSLMYFRSILIYFDAY